MNHVKSPVRPAWLAEQLKVSHQTIYSAIRRGDIAAVRIGRNIFIPWTEAQRLLGVPQSEPWVDWKARACGPDA